MSNFCNERLCVGKELLHYTDFSAFNHIIMDRTLKFSNLRNVNDKFEVQRKGLEKYAGTRYIACFCNQPYEIVPFWYIYGKGKNSEKVLLRFKDFSYNIADIINETAGKTFPQKMDFYFSLHEDKKGLVVETVKLFDIEYKECSDEVFQKDNIEYLNVFIPEKPEKGNEITFNVKIDASNLGKYKTIHWEYEHETRLMCQTNLLTAEKEVDALLVPINEKIFENLRVVVNPWATIEFIDNVKRLIWESDLSENIKKGIVVEKSELYGMLIEEEKDEQNYTANQ